MQTVGAPEGGARPPADGEEPNLDEDKHTHLIIELFARGTQSVHFDDAV